MANPISTASPVVILPTNFEAEVDKLHEDYAVELSRDSEVALENMLRIARRICAYAMHMTGRSYQLSNRKLTDDLEVINLELRNTYGGKLGKILTIASVLVGFFAVFCGLSKFCAYVPEGAADVLTQQAQTMGTASTATSSLSQLPEKNAEGDRTVIQHKQSKYQRILEDQSRKREEARQQARTSLEQAAEQEKSREACVRAAVAA